MKKTLFLIVFLFGLFINLSSVWANSSLIPLIPIGSGNLKIFGTTNLLYDKNVDDVDVLNSRISLLLNTSTHFSIFSKIELAKINESEDNWLREFWGSYRFGNTNLRFGRLLIASGFSTPLLTGLKTIKYQFSNPFSGYAYGIQTDSQYGSFRLIADITGASGEMFRDVTNWDRIEFSGRGEYKISKYFSMALTTQLSNDFQRYGFDFKYKACSIAIFDGGFYYSNEENYRKKGGFLLLDRKVTNWLSAHSQIDYLVIGEYEVSVLTTGLQIFAGENISFKIDYEDILKGSLDNNFFVCMQMKF